MIPMRQSGAALLLLSSIGLATGASAQGNEPALLGEFGDWQAYTYTAPDTKVCYVVSRPKESEPKTAKRDPVFFLITHMPGRKVAGEVSTIIGYPFKKDSTVTLSVGEASFELFTNADGAWADTPATEKKIVAAMKGGAQMTVKGTSWRGTQTVDNYSLSGLSAALTKIDETCR